MSSTNSPGTDDELFDAALADIRSDIEQHLTQAHGALPDAEGFWNVEAPNILGVLNSARGELDVDSARAEYRAARKQYIMAARAGAFEDADPFEESFEDLDVAITHIETVEESLAELTRELPKLKQSLGAVSESEIKESVEKIDASDTEDNDREGERDDEDPDEVLVDESKDVDEPEEDEDQDEVDKEASEEETTDDNSNGVPVRKPKN